MTHILVRGQHTVPAMAAQAVALAEQLLPLIGARQRLASGQQYWPTRHSFVLVEVFQGRTGRPVPLS